MKALKKFPLVFLLFVLAIILVPAMTESFAEEVESVSIPQGTFVSGCEGTNACFIPYNIMVSKDGVVRWVNQDSVAHTVTSGSSENGQSGIFDSGLIMVGTVFEHKFSNTGIYHYFCMVHPWMEGVVTVQDSSSDQTFSITMVTDKGQYYQGDTIRVSGWVSDPTLTNTITLLVHNPEKEISSIELIKPNYKGFYQQSIPISGPYWKNEGIYSIEATFGSSKVIGNFYLSSEHVSERKPISPKPGADIFIPQGTSIPGCESFSRCYLPYSYSTSVGSSVTWRNDDSAAHTVTAGTSTDGPSEEFDSSLFVSGSTFSHQFDEQGEFPYFCMVHPWMEGIIKIQAEGSAMPQAPMELDQIMAEIQTSNGMANEPMTIDLTLTDLDGNGIDHITYNIKAMQGSNLILDDQGHMHQGTLTQTHSTSPLVSDASDSTPVVITVESVGFGHDSMYLDAPGEIVTKQVVPEFGTIAGLILGVAIASIIAISAKSKLSVMTRF